MFEHSQCPNCGNPFPVERTHCRSCGLKREDISNDGSIRNKQTVPPVASDYLTEKPFNICTNCHAPLETNVVICPECGQTSQPDTSKQEFKQWLLVIFFIFVVPIAACGGCLAYPTGAKSTPEMYVAVAPAFGIQIASLTLGSTLLLLNLRDKGR